MNMRKRWMVAGALALTGWLGVRAEAAVGSPSYLNIDVTVNAQVSVAVGGVNSSTYGVVTWNTNTANQEFTAGLSASSVTVTNDSNVVEKWNLSSNANSINTAGNASTWALATSTSPSLPGADAFAVQAVFGSSNTAAGSCPGNGATDWNRSFAPPLTGALQQYTDTVFADTLLNASGGLSVPDQGSGATSKIKSSGKRVLCWRLFAPSSTATTDQQNVQVIVTAQ